MVETAGSTPKWSAGLARLAELSGQCSLLKRIAVLSNQPEAAKQLSKSQGQLRSFSVPVTVLGRAETGVSRMIQQLSAAFGERLSATPLEVLDYGEVNRDEWDSARKSEAIVCLIPSIAPFYDGVETVLARELGGVAEQVFLVVMNSADGEIGLAEPIAQEVQQILNAGSVLNRCTVCIEDHAAESLDPFLTARLLSPLITAIETQIASNLPRLNAGVTAFAGFLAMSPTALAQCLQFIDRDLQALQSLSKDATSKLQTQSQAALGGVANQIVSLSPAMRQKAEAILQSATIPHEVLTSQDSRTRFGKDLAAKARAAGYAEFDARAQTIAVNLASARALILANMDQVRDEASAHVEELQQNLGPELFATFLGPPLDALGASLFELPLEPGNQFTAAVTAAIQSVRSNSPDIPFTSGWASRIESMYRSELTANATAGWDLQNFDGSAAVELAKLWEDTGTQECGLLIGRIDALCSMVQKGMDALRLKALQIPNDPAVRAKIAAAYNDFASQLKTMGNTDRSVHSSSANTVQES
jgi:hypothetical protein